MSQKTFPTNYTEKEILNWEELILIWDPQAGNRVKFMKTKNIPIPLSVSEALDSKADYDVVQKTPTYTTTSTSSKSWLLINIDSATGEISTTSWPIEDEKHWISIQAWASWTRTWKFTQDWKRTWKFTVYLKSLIETSYWIIVSLTGWGGSWLSSSTYWKYWIQLKPNTKYKLKSYVKVLNNTSSSFSLWIKTYNSSISQVNYFRKTIPTWVSEWYQELLFTTWGTEIVWFPIFETWQSWVWTNVEFYIDHNDSKLEEIIETTNDNLTSKAQWVLWFTAIGSTDNIDQSLDTWWAYANTYTLWTSIVESATTIQEFVPTKSKMTQIWVWVVNKGTGNWTMTVHNSSNVVQASVTIANASLTNGAFNYFTVPAILTAWATYHFHLTSTVADWTVKTNVASDLNTCSYIQQYYKPTTAFNASLNWDSIDLRADEDGFLDWAKIDLVNGKLSIPDVVKTKWDWSSINYQYIWRDVRKFNSYYTANNVSWEAWTSYNIIIPTSATPWNWYVIKLQWFNFKWFKINIIWTSTSWTSIYRYSLDWTNWTSVWQIVHDTDFPWTYVVTKTIELNWLDTDILYIEVWLVSWTPRIWWLSFDFNIDTASIKTLFNYPTNKSNKETYVKTLTSATTTAIYRATKYGLPAIEFSNWEYQFLKINCEATDSVIKLSSDWTTYTTVTDGWNIALSSTTLPIVYTDITILKNRLLMASNDYNNSADKDGSLQAWVISQNKVQGLVYDVQDLQAELNRVKQFIWLI